MDTLIRDLVFSLRVLIRRPGFTFVAILTLAIGIAANTTIFTLINGVLLRPLAYPHAERLVNLWTSYPVSKGQQDIFSPPNYLDVVERAKSFEAAGGYSQFSFTLAGANDGEPEYVPGIRMTASMSAVLGVAPRLGRWFTRQEDERAETVAVLSDSLWRRRFASDPAVIGRAVQLNGRSFTVVGVLAPQTGFPSLQTQIYTPISFTSTDKAAPNRGNVYLNAVARLREGVNREAAEAELQTIAAALAAESPLNTGIQMGAISLQESLVGNVRPMLLALWAAVAFMLAVGCANVANLLLTHAAGRQREFALRRSLGATAGRLIRQLLTESVLLAGFGGVLGFLLQAWATPAIVAHLPQNFLQVGTLGFDPRMLWFTAAISMLTGVLFGLAPAAGSARGELGQALRAGERGGGSSGQRRLGRLLVIGEVAAVLVLLIGAGLVLRSLSRLSGLSPGFHTRNLIAWQMFLPPTRYPNVDSQRSFYGRVVEQVQSLPGVESVGLIQPAPFGPLNLVADSGFRIAGRPDPALDQTPQALIARASTGYFQTMEIPILRGRVFTAQDTETSNAAVISDALRRAYFANEDPIGQRLLLGRQRLEMQIVGVVGDVKHNNLRTDIRPEFYLPIARFTQGAASLIVRTSGGGPAALLPGLEKRVWSLDSAMAGNLAAPVESLLYESLAPDRIAAVLFAIFAGATLALGLVGVYGVLSYSVRQRTREIGIRLALGASPEVVLRMVLGEALRLAGVGVAAGFVAALFLSRYLQSLLFGVTAFDPLTYVVAALSLPIAALLAAYIPALRATRIDPAMSLRAE
jgi:putative ABC transport system permease protein